MMTALGKGELAKVERVVAPLRVTRRLAELGITPGAMVEMLQPGLPCILRVRGTRLTLDKRLQSHVCVSPPGANGVARRNGQS